MTDIPKDDSSNEGTPLPPFKAVPSSLFTKADKIKFFDKLTKYPSPPFKDSGCWIWKDNKAKIAPQMKGLTARKVAYAMFIGDVPPGVRITNKFYCNNNNCVNPWHTKFFPVERTEEHVLEQHDNTGKKMLTFPDGLFYFKGDVSRSIAQYDTAAIKNKTEAAYFEGVGLAVPTNTDAGKAVYKFFKDKTRCLEILSKYGKGMEESVRQSLYSGLAYAEYTDNLKEIVAEHHALYLYTDLECFLWDGSFKHYQVGLEAVKNAILATEFDLELPL